jgi:hypothetical protein
MSNVLYSINKFSEGFYMTLFPENVTPTIICDPIYISQYELSRNNIKGNTVKSVKVTYQSYEYNGVVSVASDIDTADFPLNIRGVQPFIIGSSDLVIRAAFDVDSYGRLNKPRLIFYNYNAGHGVITY